MLQNVFDSMSAADKVDGGRGGRRQGEAGAGGAAGGGSRLRPQSLGTQPQVYADPLHGPAASPKKNSTTCMRSAIATTTAAEEEGGLPDLPDLGRLERMDTPNMLMANRECSGSSNSNSSSPPSGEVGSFNLQTAAVVSTLFVCVLTVPFFSKSSFFFCEVCSRGTHTCMYLYASCWCVLREEVPVYSIHASKINLYFYVVFFVPRSRRLLPSFIHRMYNTYVVVVLFAGLCSCRTSSATSRRRLPPPCDRLTTMTTAVIPCVALRRPLTCILVHFFQRERMSFVPSNSLVLHTLSFY